MSKKSVKKGYKEQLKEVKQEIKKKPVRLFTSECVTVGHPDKVCDYISDSVLTEILKADPNARVACECMAQKDNLIIAGEVTTTAPTNYAEIARKAIDDIGYNIKGVGFDSETVNITVNVHGQSPDIAMGTADDVAGAGDQGMMIGGAVRESSDLMPLSATIARSLTVRLYDFYKKCAEENPSDPIIRPDGKSQVTVAYGKGGVVEYVDTVVVAASHSESVSIQKVRSLIKEEVVIPVLNEYGYSIDDVQSVFINPTGRFAIYGPNGDVGLTGRKIIVDTYGSYFSHGGGAFSGKDPSKVDRSGAYMARYIAKNIVASGVADRCEVQLAYAIGVVKPVSVNLNMYGTNTYPIGLISKAVYSLFDMTPKGITDMLELRSGKIDYAELSKYGHFGEFGNQEKPWENVDKAEALKEFCLKNYVEKR